MKKRIFLFLFIISGLLEIYSVVITNKILLFFSRLACIFFLLFYYLNSSKKANKTFIIILGLFLVTDILSAINKDSFYKMIPLTISRIFLAKLVFSGIKKINWRIFTMVFTTFFIVGFIIISFLYTNSNLFYTSVISTLTLITLSSFVFINLLNTEKKGNLEMFFGVFIFVISDAIFGAQKLHEINQTYTILTSISYNIGYYLICSAILIKEKKTDNYTI